MTLPQQTEPQTQPRFTVYSMMLIIAFIALTTGSVLLYLELQTYGEFPWWKIPADVSATQ